MNQLKARAKSVSTERLIKALGREAYLKLMNEVDLKAPRARKSIEIDNSPLNSQELISVQKCLKAHTWKEIGDILTVKGHRIATISSRLLMRYINNMKKS